MRLRGWHLPLLVLSVLAAAVLVVSSPGALAGQRAPRVSAPGRGLTVHTRYDSYLVHGGSAEQVRADLDAERPADPSGARFDAITNWWVSWRYGFDTAPRGCAVGSAGVSVEVTSRLPRWQRPAAAAQALTERWEHYIRALRRHEQGHAENGVRTGRTILARLRRLRSAPTCARLERSADAMARRQVARGNHWDETYDWRAEHGATQGALFP